MSEPTATSSGVSRRDALIGLGAVAGAAAAVTAFPFTAGAAGPTPTVLPAQSGELLGPSIPGLTYLGIDAFAFTTATLGAGGVQRLYQTETGMEPVPSTNRIWAPLMIPAGSVVHQINVGYQGQPIAEISRRPINQPFPALPPAQPFQLTLPASPGGPFSSTLNFTGAAPPTAPVTIEADSTYTVSFFCSPGSSVFGCSIGYLPPTQGFIPYTGGTPRVLDTRGGAKLGPGEERVVDLAIPGARTAVINLTITQTEGAGYVAVFPDGIAWPGNSSINWSGPNENVANGVITAVNAAGKIKIRGGDGTTDVIIDRIGYLI